MLNHPFRTALTRDEIIGILLGWIPGPVILTVDPNEKLSAEEEELCESWSYSVFDDRETREAQACERRLVLRNEGKPEELCREPMEAFERLDLEFRRICDEFDDEISKGAKSMLRIDARTSTPVATCYTRKSFDEWVKARPDLSSHLCSNAADRAPKRSKADQQNEAILACIEALGHCPTQLKRNKAGYGGIKAQVWDSLRGTPHFSTKKTFDNAWQRLRELNKIVEVDRSPTTANANKRL